MTNTAGAERWETELRAVRAELAALREEQRAMAEAINQLLTTFRGLATHLGISTEPYGKRGSGSSGRDLPGFA
jgi:hypothetical protein